MVVVLVEDWVEVDTVEGLEVGSVDVAVDPVDAEVDSVDVAVDVKIVVSSEESDVDDMVVVDVVVAGDCEVDGVSVAEPEGVLSPAVGLDSAIAVVDISSTSFAIRLEDKISNGFV